MSPTLSPVNAPQPQSPLAYSDSIVVAATPEALYGMVSDITRMGQWSPVTTSCWWDEGDAPTIGGPVTGVPMVGAWFTGRNEAPGRDPWETRCQVVAADPGREFAFIVGGTWVRWGYTFAEVPGGTEVTESWEMLPGGLERFGQRFGDGAAAQVRDRYETARRGIAATLAAIRQAAESSR
jgi:hypothetical protein